MTALVSLLFITMIPIFIVKLLFSLYLFVYFFETIIILVNSLAALQKKD